jgi:hypothetical protein
MRHGTAAMFILAGTLALQEHAQGDGTALSVRKLMTPDEFRASGLSKLSEAEHAALDAWLERYTQTVVQVAQSQEGRRPRDPRLSAASGYPVEVSHKDELFIINGEKFEAKTYCFNVEVGDRVMFIEGSALGACASATFVNLRTQEKCEVWCE